MNIKELKEKHLKMHELLCRIEMVGTTRDFAAAKGNKDDIPGMERRIRNIKNMYNSYLKELKEL